MTYSCSGLVACPQIQQDINSYFGINPQTISETNRFLKWLLSPQNRGMSIQRQLDSGNGHKRQVELLYQPRELITNVGDSADLSCTCDNDPCNLSTTYEIDSSVGSSYCWSATLRDLEDQCEDDPSFFAKQVMRAMDVLVRKMDRDCVEQAFALVGAFAGGQTDPEAIQTAKGAACCDGKVTTLIEEVSYEYAEMEWENSIIAFGGDFEWKSYWDSLSVACCTDLGENLNAMMNKFQIVPFYDRNIRDYATEDLGFLAMIPGSLQLFTFNEFKGAKGIRIIDDDSVKQGTLMHPNPEYYGLEFDYYAEYTCGKWVFQLKLAHELDAAPDDMFFAGDRLSGVNFVTEWYIDNPA